MWPEGPWTPEKEVGSIFEEWSQGSCGGAYTGIGVIDSRAEGDYQGRTGQACGWTMFPLELELGDIVATVCDLNPMPPTDFSHLVTLEKSKHRTRAE